MGRAPAGPTLRDGVIGAAAAGLAVVAPGGGPPGASSGHDWVLPVGAVIALVALVLLRRRPEYAVLVCLGVTTTAQVLTAGPTGLVVPLLVALALTGLRRPLPVAIGVLVVAVVAYLAGDLATGGFDSRVLAPLGLMAACTAAGVAVAGQQALVRSATERAAAAEQTRQDEAARQVADERLRIARELHDVVAHHVAVMGIQAGAAEQLLDTDRDQARTALAQVRTSARTALSELGAVVGLLRVRSEAIDGDDLRPVQAGLDRLPELVDSLRTAGLQLTVHGEPHGDTGLEELADMAAYRIVQEALTNALKHGTGTAELTVRVGRAAVIIDVVNPMAGAPGAGTGHGLPGMRERADLVGAVLTAGPDDTGRFVVHARVPVRHR